MATADVIMLRSSSPPRVFARSPTPAQLSSSPSLPSVQKLLGLRDRPRENDGRQEFKTAPNTRDGFGGFHNASALLLRGSLRVEGDIGTPGGKHMLKVKDRMQASVGMQAKGEEEAGEGSHVAKAKMKTKKRRSDEGPSGTIEGFDGSSKHAEVAEEGAKKKPKKTTNKKTSIEFQSELQGKVTKPGVNEGKALDTKSSHSKAPKTSKNIEATKPVLEDEDLQLEPAPVRRKNWTPIKSTSNPAMLLDEEEDKFPSKMLSFALLTGRFGYDGETSKAVAGREGNEAFVKKGRIDVIPSLTKPATEPRKEKKPPKDKPPAKEKRARSPTKKLTTITARATSNYFGGNEAEEPGPTVQCLGPDNTDAVARNIHNELSAPRKVPKSLSKSKSRQKSQPGAKKSTAPPPLLAPDTALKALGNQDFVFGTSTQLVADDSSIFVRETQRAIKISESTFVESSILDSSFEEPRGLPSVVKSTSSLLKTSRDLWSAATIDDEDPYLEAEVLNLADTPEIPRAIALPPPLQTKPDSVSTSRVPEDSERLNVDDVSPLLDSPRSTKLSSTLRSPARPEKLPERPSIKKSKEPKDIVPIISNETKQSRPTSSQSKKSRGGSRAPSEPPSKPIYEGFTNTELSAQVTAYGFKAKAIKSRDRMIKLLNRCWEDGQRNALRASVEHTAQFSTTSIPASDKDRATLAEAPIAEERIEDEANKPKKNSSKSKSTTTVPEAADPSKKTRGRPRKGPAASTQPSPSTTTLNPSPTKTKFFSTAPTPTLDNISSSEPETPSPPRPRSLTTLSFTATSSSKPPPSSDLSLSKSIHSAILAQPSHPTSPHLNPTFHTQILMYQPIPIEALTRWLNKEGFRLVDEDREIGPMEVREWLEGKGICCLWDGSTKNGWKKRKGRKGNEEGEE